MPVIKYTAQRENMDCGVACLAMITGKTYDEVKAELKLDISDGISEYVLDNYLADNGYAVARIHPFNAYQEKVRDKWPIEPFADMHLCIVETGVGPHYVLMLTSWDVVLDPAIEGVVNIDEYEEILSIAGIAKV